jgi:hypothetical protein
MGSVFFSQRDRAYIASTDAIDRSALRLIATSFLAIFVQTQKNSERILLMRFVNNRKYRFSNGHIDKKYD